MKKKETYDGNILFSFSGGSLCCAVFGFGVLRVVLEHRDGRNG